VFLTGPFFLCASFTPVLVHRWHTWDVTCREGGLPTFVWELRYERSRMVWFERADGGIQKLELTPYGGRVTACGFKRREHEPSRS